MESGDDAAVWRHGPTLATVHTLDFFMPVVDDPYDYGRIAAANSLSDVYAMGGRPILALAILGMPVKKIRPEVMARVLEGGAAVCAEAGVPIAGGHSIDDEEPKFGLSVTGIVHPDRVWTNRGAREGDVLILTKPLGSGTMGSAIKQGKLSEDDYATFVWCTTTLNRTAAEAGQAIGGVMACTDVTGFGLLGHLHKMATASGVQARISMATIPELPGARALIEQGVVPGATARNLGWYTATFAPEVTEIDKKLLADPQTSGGLLFAVDPAYADPLLAELERMGTPAAAKIGRFVAMEGPAVHVEP